MEPVDFKMDTSKGPLSISISWGAWTEIWFANHESGGPEIDEVIRTEDELRDGLSRLGLPPREASELAAEVWGELDEEERSELAAVKGLDESTKEWRQRTGHVSWWRYWFGSRGESKK